MSTPIGDLNMHLFAISDTYWESRIISHKADADLLKRIYLSGTNAGLCPELMLFWGETKKTFLIKK